MYVNMTILPTDKSEALKFKNTFLALCNLIKKNEELSKK